LATNIYKNPLRKASKFFKANELKIPFSVAASEFGLTGYINYFLQHKIGKLIK